MAGFGFFVILPFILMLYPAKEAVAFFLSISLGGVLLQWFLVRKHVNYRLTMQLGLGALFGVPPGNLVLMQVHVGTLKLLVGLSVLAAVILMMVRRENPDSPPRTPQTAAVILAGFLSGLLNGAVGQAGPPAALLMARTGLDKAVVRGTLVAFFVAVNAGALVALAHTGVLNGEIAGAAGRVLPFYGLGLLLGDHLFKRSNEGAYRCLILGVLFTAAVTGMVSGLRALR